MIAAAKENKEEFEKIYYTTTKWVFFITALSLAWLILYGKELITLFFSENYIAAYSSLVILSIAYLINACIYTSRDILLLYNKTRVIFVATVLSCIINILLNIVFIPIYGMIGAALATAISLTFLSMLLFIQTKKETKINPLRKRIILAAFLIGIAAFLTLNITKLIKLEGKMLILSSIIIITVLSIALIYLSGILEKEDKDMAETILNKIKNTIPWKTSKKS